jgi:hypothetical protein
VAELAVKILERGYEPTRDADYAARLAGAGVPKSAIDISLSFFQRVRAGAFTEVLRTVETLLARPGTSYADWAKHNAARMLS